MERSPREMEVLSTMISSEYSGNFCSMNESRAEEFFSDLRDDCFNLYTGKMESDFDAKKSDFEGKDLKKLHNKTKKTCYAQVCSILIF